MSIDKKYVDQILKVSEKAALASSYLVGKKDKITADQAAVDAMRSELNNINMNGEVVIGEGSLDEAPMLYTGEKLGNKNGPYFDIAVDPLEGTNFAANNLPGATSVIAIAEKGNLFNAPETYMDKIATGKIENGVVDLDYRIKKNISTLYFGFVTYNAPRTSPSVINLILIFSCFNSSIIFLCLGLSITQAVTEEISLFIKSAKLEIFFFNGLSKSISPFSILPVAILSI